MALTSSPLEPRDRPLKAGRSALLMVDLQHHCCVRDGGTFTEDPERWPEERRAAYFDQLEGETLPNAAALAEACRQSGIEVIYCVIEALTRDGRDRGLDHKLSNILIPKGSLEAQIVEAVAPGEDEIVLPKTASGVFPSTNLHYLLRNLGIEDLAVAGVFTDQCVESAVRDAADLGYRVTLVGDACCGSSPGAHAHTLKAMRGYARIATTGEILAELR
ncbi:cysteine hydrolase family protein [Algihabitans albus]|uniref:cysteine hydrolase family protein n=1 Tax=Algihabitans albus TaxID=2164067 RepID=UPI000E5D5CE2|nr:isochorismatase family cysteine hydrolase [Algihabitans albus]